MTRNAPREGTRQALWGGPDAGERIEWRLAEAEYGAREAARGMAEQMAAIADVLADAHRYPDVYVMLDEEPTPLDLEIAYDAAVADIAMRLSIAEGTVVQLARQAVTLRSRAPRMWATFAEGETSAANARRLAETLESMPTDPVSDAAMDEKAIELERLAPARFAERMRVLRERLHPRTLDDRHREAVRKRATWRENDRDGMAWLGFHLPAPQVQAAWQRIDEAAAHLADRPDEDRTLDQLRADVAADLLTGASDPETAPRVTVGVLVPVLTLLGTSDEPATLDGYGPIDADTARKLAAHAPSFHRILTHPVSSAILDVDRTRYRPPADLKRWLAIRDGTCRFPGCGRLAKYCDIDHTLGWAKGGPTAASNLGHLSQRHHTLKDRSKWKVEQSPGGVFTWTSPTGAIGTSDPPPF